MIHTKIRHFLTLTRILSLAALFLLILLSVRHPLNAQAVTQGYGTDQPLQRGILVKFKDGDTTKVTPVTQATMDKLYGVVVDPNDAPVTLSSDNQKAFVATNGRYDVLVSNQNGPILKGDYITVSAIDGVGMKAGQIEPFIVGRALSDYDGKTKAISSTQISDSAGNKIGVTISRVSVDIGVTHNPLLKAEQPNMPAFLKKAAESIAGKPVSTARVYTSVVIFIISTILAGTLMFGGVRSAIISIGRNPLSKKSIIRGMIQVVLVGLTIFITGVFGVYLLLKL